MGKVMTVVSTKGQVVLLKQFRDQLGIRPGSKLIERMEGNKLVLEKPQTDIVALMEATAKKYGRKKPYSSHEYEEAMEQGDY